MKVLHLMDAHYGLRLAVCCLPGLVASKLVGSSGEGILANGGAIGLLALGVVVVLFWGRIRDFFVPVQVDELEDDSAHFDHADEAVVAGETAADVLRLLAELREKCGEVDRLSDRLIAIESAVDPHATYAQVVQRALARRKLT